MLKFLKIFQKSLLIFVKILLVFLLFMVFYEFYKGDSDELRRGLNRVSAIVGSTFIVICYIMIRVYGGFSIGKKRTREIILSMIMSIIVTDGFTYVQLCIMEKRVMKISSLIAIFFIQMVVVIILTKLSTNLYYMINPPKKMVIIHDDFERVSLIVKKLSAYQNRFNVVRIMNYQDNELNRSIRNSDGVLLIDISPEMQQQIIEYCYKRGKDVHLIPSINDVVTKNSFHELFDDISVFSYEGKAFSIEQRIIKRSIDLVLSCAATLLISPVMLIIAIAIKISDGGKIFYKQERATRGGRIFNVLKFRTMVEDAEKNGAVLSTINDERITKIGAVLRKTRLDELPQLINIINGDMSIVGPRPERKEIAIEYEKDLPEFRYRLRVKAGLTGLAQIMGKYNTSPKDKLMLDLMYIEEYSLKLDIKIMFQTVVVCLTPEKTEGVNPDEEIKPTSKKV